MTTHTNQIHSEFESSFEHVSRQDHSVADILFEQLEYLLRYCDQERDRLSRVSAILLESFQ
jgi:hypothetical protein